MVGVRLPRHRTPHERPRHVFILLATLGLIARMTRSGRRATESARAGGPPRRSRGGAGPAIFCPYRQAQLDVGLQASLGDSIRFSANAELHRLAHAPASSHSRAVHRRGPDARSQCGALPRLPAAAPRHGGRVACLDDPEPPAITGSRARRGRGVAAAPPGTAHRHRGDARRIPLKLGTYCRRLGAPALARLGRSWRSFSHCGRGRAAWCRSRCSAGRAPCSRDSVAFESRCAAGACSSRRRAHRSLAGPALGPSFGLYRLVYDWPGFSFIRVPVALHARDGARDRILAAAGFDWLTARLAARARSILGRPPRRRAPARRASSPRHCSSRRRVFSLPAA